MAVFFPTGLHQPPQEARVAVPPAHGPPGHPPPPLQEGRGIQPDAVRHSAEVEEQDGGGTWWTPYRRTIDAKKQRI